MFSTASSIKSVLIVNGQADEVGLEILGVVIWQQHGTSRGILPLEAICPWRHFDNPNRRARGQMQLTEAWGHHSTP